MSEIIIDPAVIKRTQETLGKYVKKPVLSEKLLKKPPFRFLYDVFIAVIQNTGCFEGLYTGDELNFENINDRESKMQFLQKMIDTIKIATNEPLTVRTSKIVAGHEPEKTNELLQLMGIVIDEKIDWRAAVDEVNKDAILGNPKRKSKEKDAKERKATEKLSPPKVNGTKKTESPKDSTKAEIKEKIKPKEPKEVKERPSKKPSKPAEAEKKEERKSKSKSVIKEPSKKTSPDKAKKSPTEGSDKAKKSPTEGLDKAKKSPTESSDKVKKSPTEGSDKPKKSPTEGSDKSKKSPKEGSDKSKKSPTEGLDKVKRSLVEASEKTKKSPVETVKFESESRTELSKPEENMKLREEPMKEKAIMESPRYEVKGDDKIEIPMENGSLTTGFPSNERRASKRAEEILLTAAAEDTNDTESRLSSGSKRSSSRSHRSSAEKSRNSKHEGVNDKMPSESTGESLQTVTEEPPYKANLNSVQKSQQNSTENPEVKRESTFVRENSKEAAQNPARPRTSLRPPSARPASARPGAPRRRDRNIEIILQPNDQVKLSGISVKLETFNSELEDDGENLVIIENPNTEDPLQESVRMDNRIGEDESLQQGHLVQQILETQKELVQGGSPDTEQKHDKDYDITKLNSRQSSARQMNSLRDVIQNLTKSVNPLGKLMDFIPEDIDAMQLELTMWRDTYTQSSIELKKERSLTESVTEPMKNQLVTIESTIKEYHEMIDACRAKILQNAEKIQKLLTTQ